MSNRLLKRVRLGDTNLEVTRAVVGTMMFGKRADAQEARRIVDVALGHGVNVFDTANIYNDGESERLLGRILGERRRHCVIATKVGYGHASDGGEEGLSPAAIHRAIDASLQRLNTDHVDIYYLHRPDYETPVAESLVAVQEVIAAGKARFFGISNFGAWQSLEVLHLCDAHGWRRPVMTQMIYNLLVRQLDYEYVRFCRHHGLHLTVYNPLAGGLLTGKYHSLNDEHAGNRFVGNANYRRRYWSERLLTAVEPLAAIAGNCDLSLTHLALAWILERGCADSILLGPSSEQQLRDCLAAGECTVPPAALQALEAFFREFDGTDATYAR